MSVRMLQFYLMYVIYFLMFTKMGGGRQKCYNFVLRVPNFHYLTLVVSYTRL